MTQSTNHVPNQTHKGLSVRSDSYDRIKAIATAHGVPLASVVEWAVDALEKHDPRGQVQGEPAAEVTK